MSEWKQRRDLRGLSRLLWYWRRLWRRPHMVYMGLDGVGGIPGREAGLSGQCLFIATCYYWFHRWTGVQVKRWEYAADGFPLMMSEARKVELRRQFGRR